MKKAKNLLMGSGLALQSTRVLQDRSVGGLTGTMTGFVGLGVVGGVSDVAFEMASGKFGKKKKKY